MPYRLTIVIAVVVAAVVDFAKRIETQRAKQ